MAGKQRLIAGIVGALAGVSAAIALLYFTAQRPADPHAGHGDGSSGASVTIVDPPPLQPLYPAPEFSLMDQDGNPTSLESLRGKPWIVGFIFTRCAGPCPVMTGKLVAMQKTLNDPEMRFVLVSVDPEHDTPPVLKAYADVHQADPGRSVLLTGSREQVYELAKGLHLTATQAPESGMILHDERFLLVDANGQVRGIYHSADAEKMAKLPSDARALLAEARDGGRL